MNPIERSVAVKRRATEDGFDAVGITALERNAHAAELDRWRAAGHAATLTYLHRQAEKRKEPSRILPQARVAAGTLTNYFPGRPRPPPLPHPRPAGAAPYAWAPHYHRH